MKLDNTNIGKVLKQEINEYLDREFNNKRISQELYEKAKSNVIKNILAWLNDENIGRLSPNLKLGIVDAVNEKKWADLSELYFD